MDTDTQAAAAIYGHFQGSRLTGVRVMPIPGAVNAFVLKFETPEESVGELFIQPYLETHHEVNLLVAPKMRLQITPCKK